MPALTDAFVLELLSTLKAGAGYPEIATALGAGAAMERITAAQLPAQCILFNNQMSVTNGVDVRALLQRLPDYAECPIFMVTAITDRQCIDRA